MTAPARLTRATLWPKLGRLRKTLLTLLHGAPGGAGPGPPAAAPSSGSGLILIFDTDLKALRALEALEEKRQRQLAAPAKPSSLAKARRLPGATRSEQLRAIRIRERRLRPIIRRVQARLREILSPRALRHAWSTQQLAHQGHARTARQVWEDVRAELVAALLAPIRKEIPTAEQLAERQIGALIEGLADRGELAVRAQLEALAALMDEGPSEAVLRAIAEAAGLTARQTELVARFVGQRLADGWTDAQAARAATDYAGRLATQRAELIARTEAVRYTSALVLERGRDVGGRIVKQWVSARDSDVDAICRLLDASPPIPIDEPFEAMGLSFDGPPAHPGCRCIPEIWSVES